MSRLRPYSGHRLDRYQHLGSTWSARTYDTDRSGERTYRFNTLGYRGDEFDTDARLKVFVFGESDAFGLGVEFEESWPWRVAYDVAEQRGIAARDVCVMNFADGGASNAAIARQVLTQCAAVRPDLVLINFAQHRRTEGLLDGSTFPIGPWHQESSTERAAEDAHEAGGLRARLAAQLERGRSFLRFCDHDQGLVQSVRDVLLVQEALRNDGIEAVAISRDPGHYRRPDLLQDEVVGPLFARIDPRFFALHIDPERLGNSVDWSPDGHHYGPRTHADIGNAVALHLGGRPGAASDDADRREHQRAVADVTGAVHDFYTEMPFSYHGDVDDAVEAIRRATVDTVYPDLHAFFTRWRATRTLPDGTLNLTVLDVGCGAGWLAHSMALHYGVDVDAIDLVPAAIERAREVGTAAGTAARVRFRECNVFDFHSAQRYDLIVSIGVLHHTGDAQAALRRIARYLAPGGSIYLGLYHAYGRRPFLDELQRIVREVGEEAAFERYLALDRARAHDLALARSWFRDQVLHPHESQHTLEEVSGWLDALDLELVSTSINGFQPFGDRRELFEAEPQLAERARRALSRERRYFPGFFTVLARRR